MDHSRLTLSSLFLVAIIFPHHGDAAPNILLIVADDLGWNDVGYHGSHILTPNLDELAGGGVILDNFYVSPVCSPSRAQLMSGRLAMNLGIQGVVQINSPSGLPLDVPTMADVLRDAGYATHGVGKWHLGIFKESYLPTRRGFDSFYGGMAGSQFYFNHSKCVPYGQELSCGLDLRDNEELVYGNNEYATSLFARKAVEIVENHDSNQPLFLYVPFTAPHVPLEVPQMYADMYPDLQGDSQIYAGMVTCLDEAVGNITQAFRDRGMWEETVMVFMSDNGAVTRYGSNDPLTEGKGTLWEGGVRVPAFVHGCIEHPGTVSRDLIHVTDWFPTFMHLAGNTNEADGIYGINVWSAISLGTEGPREELLIGIDDPSRNTDREPNVFYPHAAIRYRDWKLVTEFLVDHVEEPDGTFRFPEDLGLWLFNITEDPSESVDLSAENPDVVNFLLQRLAFYHARRVPLQPDCVDVRSNPIHHNGTWSPWVQENEPLDLDIYCLNPTGTDDGGAGGSSGGTSGDTEDGEDDGDAGPTSDDNANGGVSLSRQLSTALPLVIISTWLLNQVCSYILLLINSAGAP